MGSARGRAQDPLLPWEIRFCVFAGGHGARPYLNLLVEKLLNNPLYIVAGQVLGCLRLR
jgi:hypothetical protein